MNISRGSELRQMGRGNGSNPEAQASADAVVKFDFTYNRLSSKQEYSCEERKVGYMKKKLTVIIQTGVQISIALRFRLKLSDIIAAALLISGYGDGFSPSALAHLLSEECETL